MLLIRLSAALMHSLVCPASCLIGPAGSCPHVHSPLPIIFMNILWNVAVAALIPNGIDEMAERNKVVGLRFGTGLAVEAAVQLTEMGKKPISVKQAAVAVAAEAQVEAEAG